MRAGVTLIQNNIRCTLKKHTVFFSLFFFLLTKRAQFFFYQWNDLEKSMIPVFAIVRRFRSQFELLLYVCDFKESSRNWEPADVQFVPLSKKNKKKNKCLQRSKTHHGSVFYTARGKKCSRVFCRDPSRVYDVLPKSKGHHRTEIGNDPPSC